MRIFVFVTGLFVFFNSYSFAAGPDFIRVRTFKNLAEFPSVKNAKIENINSLAWRLSGEKLFFNGKKLSDRNVILKKSNQYEIISILPVNDYLAGVVASEMPVAWPIEALKAQAVVARSFTLARLKEKKPGYFDMESDESDQMFSLTISAKAYQAVLETEDLVLQDDRDHTLKAYYHSDCGGQTVDAKEVWGGEGFQSGTTQDSWCWIRSSNRWFYEIEKSQFIKKLGLTQLPDEPFQLVWKDRSQKINLFGEVFSVQKLRQIFGFSNIKSTPSQVDVGEKTVKISGQGFGHGAGLCQWGSKAQADNGVRFKELLSHYYPKAHLSVDKFKLASDVQGFRHLFAVSN